MPRIKQLPAKVLKRIGQLRRLGGRGLVRTAYVLTLGPTVYSLTEPARKLEARRYRRRARNDSLDARLKRLEERMRNEVGSNDAPPPGVRKFHEDRGRFAQALEAALNLAHTACTPPVVAVDWKANAITSAVVAGTPFSGTAAERSSVEESILTIHRAGYVLGDIDQDSVIIAGADGRAVFVDLQHAVPLAGLSRDMSIHLRDADSARCNELFGTKLMTAAELRTGTLAMASGDRPEHEKRGDQAYAAIVIRDDIRWGGIWNTDVGTARWNYVLKDRLPIPQGGTVLDLGCGNGFNPLQMLRHGAGSAVGVEYRDVVIRDGEFLKKTYEWLDNRAYDFSYIHGSFGDLPDFGLGRFDMVSALCSLYYLDDRHMRDIACHVRTLTDLFVMQCNTDHLIHRDEEDQFRRASIEFTVELLEQAGFNRQEVIAPRGYSRPLVIGRAA